MKQSITIKDDNGKEQTFYKLDELIKYLDSFKMSFLPNGFTYKLTKE
jgi:uncharacterized protein YrzB (UPF0473 family)